MPDNSSTKTPPRNIPATLQQVYESSGKQLPAHQRAAAAGKKKKSGVFSFITFGRKTKTSRPSTTAASTANSNDIIESSRAAAKDRRRQPLKWLFRRNKNKLNKPSRASEFSRPSLVIDENEDEEASQRSDKVAPVAGAGKKKSDSQKKSSGGKRPMTHIFTTSQGQNEDGSPILEDDISSVTCEEMDSIPIKPVCVHLCVPLFQRTFVVLTSVVLSQRKSRSRPKNFLTRSSRNVDIPRRSFKPSSRPITTSQLHCKKPVTMSISLVSFELEIFANSKRFWAVV